MPPAIAIEASPRSSARSSTRRAPSRRDDQTRQTKLRLFGAAIELVTEVGWRRTTVEQIAERAGVAKGTFFVHFKTKEAIVLALVQAQTGAASAARDAVHAAGGTALERLKVATLTLGSQAAESIELSRAVLIASLESREVGSATDAVFTRLHQRMIEDAREALTAGLLEGPDAETVATLLMACYLGAALHCTSSPTAKSLDAVLRPLVDATIAALAPKTPARAKARAHQKTTSRKGAGK